MAKPPITEPEFGEMFEDYMAMVELAHGAEGRRIVEIGISVKLSLYKLKDFLVATIKPDESKPGSVKFVKEILERQRDVASLLTGEVLRSLNIEFTQEKLQEFDDLSNRFITNINQFEPVKE